MIFHASVPADDPERVAGVIAELWCGRHVPFPPFPGSWIAFAFDAQGSAIETTPRNLHQIPGNLEVETREVAESPRYGATHLAIASPLTEAQVLEIGRREGWLVRTCRRGEPGAMGFDLIELWLENAFLVEVLTPGMQVQYLDFMTGTPARRMFGLEEAA